MVRRAVAWENGAGIALLLAALCVLLMLQGWKSRIPGFGVITAIEAAQEFIDHHRLPEKGAITSSESFTPPGLTWLMLPGVLMARDPRLFEYHRKPGLVRWRMRRRLSGRAPVLRSKCCARRSGPVLVSASSI